MGDRAPGAFYIWSTVHKQISDGVQIERDFYLALFVANSDSDLSQNLSGTPVL